jgi:hypothetical protein
VDCGAVAEVWEGRLGGQSFGFDPRKSRFRENFGIWVTRALSRKHAADGAEVIPRRLAGSPRHGATGMTPYLCVTGSAATSEQIHERYVVSCGNRNRCAGVTPHDFSVSLLLRSLLHGRAGNRW